MASPAPEFRLGCRSRCAGRGPRRSSGRRWGFRRWEACSHFLRLATYGWHPPPARLHPRPGLTSQIARIRSPCCRTSAETLSHTTSRNPAHGEPLAEEEPVDEHVAERRERRRRARAAGRRSRGQPATDRAHEEDRPVLDLRLVSYGQAEAAPLKRGYQSPRAIALPSVGGIYQLCHGDSIRDLCGQLGQRSRFMG